MVCGIYILNLISGLPIRKYSIIL